MTRASAIPRGIRNHNPGNIERSKDPWQGLADRQSDRRFFVFSEPKWGIRAIARVLVTYQDRHGIADVRGLISRWAPPKENDTAAYVRAVAAAVGVESNERIDVHRYEITRPLVEAIIAHENGEQPYTAAQIDAGLVLAGIEPPRRPLARTRTVRGGQAAGGAAALGPLAWLAEQFGVFRPVLDWVRENPFPSLAILGAAVMVGVAIVIWARLDDRRRGLR